MTVGGSQFETTHRVQVADARSMEALDDESVELVVTSPPYPMIEMWDDAFSSMDDAVEEYLDAGEGQAAFERMHDVLESVWAEVERVLAPGGVACINVGDATRRVDDRFRVYPNHAEIIQRCTALGLDPLPDILWRKPANSGTKFLGSARPTNGYVTLEHEYILVFRKGGPRSFGDGERRAESALFWEERNAWFSDLWTDVRGAGQSLGENGRRERSAAFPLEIPYRLICMYSVYGDTVVDPFWGTGTTSVAAMVAGRSSVGYELDSELVNAFEEALEGALELSRTVGENRLSDHREFVVERETNGDPPGHWATNYDFPVVMKQERDLQLYAIDKVERRGEAYVAVHEPLS